MSIQKRPLLASSLLDFRTAQFGVSGGSIFQNIQVFRLGISPTGLTIEAFEGSRNDPDHLRPNLSRSSSSLPSASPRPTSTREATESRSPPTDGTPAMVRSRSRLIATRRCPTVSERTRSTGSSASTTTEFGWRGRLRMPRRETGWISKATGREASR